MIPTKSSAQTPPVANDDFFYFDINLQPIFPLSNDEVNGQGIITSVSSSPTATISFTNDAIDYYPNELPNYLVDVLSYTITDDTGLEATATIFVDMSYFTPVLVDDFFMAEWDGCSVFNVSFNDQTLFSPFEIVPIDVPPGITVEAFTNGLIEICTDLSDFSTVQFWYTIVNNDTAQVTVELVPPDFPDAVNDTIQCLFNAFVIVDVLNNDYFSYEPDIADFSQAANGSVSLSQDNRLIYTPSDNFTGFDTFQYALLNNVTSEFDVADVFVEVSEPVGITQADLHQTFSWTFDPNIGLIVLSTIEGNIELFSLDGRLQLRQKESFNDRQTIDTSNIAPGVYLLKIGNHVNRVWIRAAY